MRCFDVIVFPGIAQCGGSRTRFRDAGATSRAASCENRIERPSPFFYPMQKEVKKILAVVNDLFFSVKISDAAKRAGMTLEFVKDEDELIEKAKGNPTLIIFDLNYESVNPLAVIARLKASAETKGISLIGYLSHVQGELKQAAQEAGCNMVMARSAFSQNMSQIFKRHSGMM
jgi:PleD family two-component response regulator